MLGRLLGDGADDGERAIGRVEHVELALDPLILLKAAVDLRAKRDRGARSDRLM